MQRIRLTFRLTVLKYPLSLNYVSKTEQLIKINYNQNLVQMILHALFISSMLVISHRLNYLIAINIILSRVVWSFVQQMIDRRKVCRPFLTSYL